MNTLTDTSEITGLSGFFKTLEETNSPSNRIVLYRGHADGTWVLKPALFRKASQRKDEKNIFRELISVQPTAFEQDRNVFEQLVRMAHFSLPTRLLDLSYNPLVALFFACETNHEKDGALVTLTAPKVQVRYFDSDTVSCLANLSFLKGNERDKLRKITTLSSLAKSHEGERLLQFIKAEKPYFLPEIDPGDLNSVIVVRPKQTNPRIIAQQGAFLLFGLTSALKPDNSFKISVSQTRIPAKAKSRILRDLDRVNINRAALFPEVESAAKYIMSKLVPVEGEETDAISKPKRSTKVVRPKLDKRPKSK